MKNGRWIEVGCLAIGCAFAFACADAAAQTCPAALEIPGAAAAAAELAQAPDRLDSRLTVAAALMERGCYADVVVVAEAGRELHPRSNELVLLLRDARSMLAEQQYFAGLEEAEASAKVRRNMLRCAQLSDVAACDAALAAKPDDPVLLVQKGDALIAAGKLGEALAAYRGALEKAPSDATALTKIEAAEAKRADAAAACFDAAGGQTALRGCELALQPGAAGAFEIQRRKGFLLQQSADNARALEAYLAAAELKSDDRATAAAVVALVEATDRADYVALVARGTALTTLDRPADAIRVLRGAASLAPDLEAAKAPLAAAERRRRTAANTCLRESAERALAACRAALLQGAPDELDLLVRTAALLGEAGDAPSARPLLQRAAALKPNDPRVMAELARLAAGTQRVARTDAAASAATRYSNVEPRGQAH